ncbi:hypothetical protein M501DRAFT_902487, partial [Patellaria atrata CBS 101060]
QQHKHIWQEFFQFQRDQKIEPWAKVIVHGVPIQPFQEAEGMQILKEEIKTFNSFTIVGRPRWLSKREER